MMTDTTNEPALAALVKQRHDEGWSFREMEKRAAERGYSISHASLADHAKGVVRKMPDRDQIEALAAALDVGIDAVRAAAMKQYWGYTPRELTNRKASRLFAAVPADTTPDEEAELKRMIEVWAATRRRGQ